MSTNVTADLAQDLRSSGSGWALRAEDFLSTLETLNTTNGTLLIPEAADARARLDRAAVFAASACVEGSLVLNDVEVTRAEARGSGQELPLGLDDADRTVDQTRIIDNLHEPFRQPPPPDENNRRYHWIDGLGASSRLEKDEATSFNTAADQLLYELADNVHRWSEADAAVAAVSVTDGGSQSYKRLHVVVADNGIGILGSLGRKSSSDARGDCILSSPEPYSKRATAALENLCSYGFRDRNVTPAIGGHGLNEVTNLVGKWGGSLDIYTGIGGGHFVAVSRTGSDKWNEPTMAYVAAGATDMVHANGTLVRVTLNASPRS